MRIEDEILSFPVLDWGVCLRSLQGPSQPPGGRLVLTHGSAVATLTFLAPLAGDAPMQRRASRRGGDTVDCWMAPALFAPVLSALEAGRARSVQLQGPRDGFGQLDLHGSSRRPATATA